MIRILLSHDEIERLERLLRETADPKLRARVRIVLLAHRSLPHGQIARDTGTSRSSVQRWLNAYQEQGLDGLLPRKPGKPHPKLTDELAPMLRDWVLGGPRALGLDLAHWTYAELAEHLFRTRGLRVGKSAMQVFCHKHGIRPPRPAGRFPRGVPEEAGHCP